jgi:hypothetical protein
MLGPTHCIRTADLSSRIHRQLSSNLSLIEVRSLVEDLLSIARISLGKCYQVSVALNDVAIECCPHAGLKAYHRENHTRSLACMSYLRAYMQDMGSRFRNVVHELTFRV